MILAEPLNDVPFIVREVRNVVAVVAFPLREPVSVPDSPPLNVALPAKVLVELSFKVPPSIEPACEYILALLPKPVVKGKFHISS